MRRFNTYDGLLAVVLQVKDTKLVYLVKIKCHSNTAHTGMLIFLSRYAFSQTVKGCDSNFEVRIFIFISMHTIFCQATHSFLLLIWIWNLETRVSHNWQPYHLIYWLCNDYVYFKCSFVLNWIHYLTVK